MSSRISVHYSLANVTMLILTQKGRQMYDFTFNLIISIQIFTWMWVKMKKKTCVTRGTHQKVKRKFDFLRKRMKGEKLIYRKVHKNHCVTQFSATNFLYLIKLFNFYSGKINLLAIQYFSIKLWPLSLRKGITRIDFISYSSRVFTLVWPHHTVSKQQP